jgi:hypothetical protein
MDILESLTSDFDLLRDLTIDLTIATNAQDRESHFRQLARLHDVTMKAQSAALNIVSLEAIEFTKRKLLERSDIMEDIAISIQRTNRPELRDTKMDLYSDLVLQRITDTERDILPYIAEKVPEPDRRHMGGVYENYRDIALDHDFHHPRAV